jgi:hypothetical protein
LHTISRDGARIFFTADETGAGGQTGDVYMRVNGTSTVQINASERTDCADHSPCNGTPEPDPAGPQPAQFEEATPDGMHVFFSSSEQLTDQAGGGLYRYDVNAPAGHHLALLAAGAGEMMGVSDDGSYVYLIGGVTIELLHNGMTRVIGTVPIGDTSANSYSESYDLLAKASQVSPDGRFVVFSSRSGDGLTGYDQTGCVNGCNEIYEYDAAANNGAGLLRCVSCRPDGVPASSSASSVQRINQSAFGKSPHVSTFLADDGEVFFNTGDPLVPGDVNGGVRDVYEYDPVSSSVRLISSGHSQFNSYFIAASPDGSNVFFLTRDQLVGWDVDQNYDVYDARAGGGLPEPSPASSVACGEGGCQGSLVLPPALGTIGSFVFAGAGDLAPSSRAAKPGLTKARRLARALKACRRKRRSRGSRRRCEAAARKAYAAHARNSRQRGIQR